MRDLGVSFSEVLDTLFEIQGQHMTQVMRNLPLTHQKGLTPAVDPAMAAAKSQACRDVMRRLITKLVPEDQQGKWSDHIEAKVKEAYKVAGFIRQPPVEVSMPYSKHAEEGPADD